MPSPEPTPAGPEPSLKEAGPSRPGADPAEAGAKPHGPGAEPQWSQPKRSEPERSEPDPGVRDGIEPVALGLSPLEPPDGVAVEGPVENAEAAPEDAQEAPESQPTAHAADTAKQAPLQAPVAQPRQLSLPARLEAILYLKGKPLTLGDLAEIAAVPREEAELALITLMADYAHRDTALEIHQEGQRYSLQLRDSLGDLVQSLLPVDLSTAALRTLATIALKKRILQSDLVELRGSGAYDHIKELLAQNFIERKRQSEGRSYWLSLTEKFHRTFAVTTVAGPARPSTGRGAGASKAKTPPASPDRQ